MIKEERLLISLNGNDLRRSSDILYGFATLPRAILELEENLMEDLTNPSTRPVTIVFFASLLACHTTITASK